MEHLPWYEIALRELEDWIQPIVAFLILIWLLGRMAIKKKRAKTAAEPAPSQPAPAPAQEKAEAVAPSPMAAIKAAMQSWDQGGQPSEPRAPARHRGDNPAASPYREEGVRAGCLLWALVIIGGLSVVYYFFSEEIHQLWREIVRSLD